MHLNLRININTMVWVKLTDAGRLEHQRKQKEYAPTLDYLPPHEENGWSEWQLWVLMHYFGAMLTHSGINAPFGMEIALTDPNKE